MYTILELQVAYFCVDLVCKIYSCQNYRSVFNGLYRTANFMVIEHKTSLAFRDVVLYRAVSTTVLA